MICAYSFEILIGNHPCHPCPPSSYYLIPPFYSHKLHKQPHPLFQHSFRSQILHHHYIRTSRLPRTRHPSQSYSRTSHTHRTRSGAIVPLTYPFICLLHQSPFKRRRIWPCHCSNDPLTHVPPQALCCSNQHPKGESPLILFCEA